MSSLITSDKIKTRHFHSTNFVDDLYSINDGGELGRFFYEYPKDPKLKVKQGDHARFLNLDITSKEVTFI